MARFSMTAPLKRVLVAHARDAFQSQEYLSANWAKYGYKFEPDFKAACTESDQFIALLEQHGAHVDVLPSSNMTGMDSMYVHDPIVTLGQGFGLCKMGKSLREGEPDAIGSWLVDQKLELLGKISGEGKLEGGDVVWLHPTLAAVGIGYRSNEMGLSQLKAMTGQSDLDIIPVHMPHWNGPTDVLHLMSIVSPLVEKTLLVYSRLMPVGFRERLLQEEFTLIEVPDAEYNSMGCNVLSLGNGKCVIEQQNSQTAALLRSHGLEVLEYDGSNISHPGEGGPTCLTRPLVRQ